MMNGNNNQQQQQKSSTSTMVQQPQQQSPRRNSLGSSILAPLSLPERTHLPLAELLLQQQQQQQVHEEEINKKQEEQEQHFIQQRTMKKEQQQAREQIDHSTAAVASMEDEEYNEQQQQQEEEELDNEDDHELMMALNLAGEDAKFKQCEKLLMRAVKLKWEQNYQMAFSITRYCVEKWPQYYHAHFQNGLTLHSMSKPAEAIQNFRNCINCKQTISVTYEHIAQGWIHFLSENMEDAEKEFEKAIEAEPTCSYAYFSRGYVEDVLKKLDRAIESFHLALKYGPRYSPCGIYNNQAWCYEQKKSSTTETLKYYSLAIESNPSFVRAYYNRSKVFQELNQFDDAIRDLEKVLQINPTHLYSYLELGDVYWFDKNQRDKALHYYSYAKNIISPTNVYAYLLIASIYAHEKNFELANEELNLGMEKCYQSDFLAELQKKKVHYDKLYLEYLDQDQTKKGDPVHLRAISDIKAREERDTYILNNKFYENKYRTKMKQRLKALLYIPLSDLEIEATPLTRKPTDSIFEMSPTKLSPMRPVDFNYYIYYHYEHWNVGSVLFSDVTVITRR